jgi:hypothetical protein
MFNLQDIQAAKVQTVNRSEVNLTKSNLYFMESLELFEEFQKNSDKLILRESANKLTESIRLNPKNNKTYFLLAYIFFLLDNYPLSFKYLSFAGDIPEARQLKALLEGKSDFENGQEPEETDKIPEQVHQIDQRMVDQINKMTKPPDLKMVSKSFLNKIKIF